MVILSQGKNLMQQLDLRVSGAQRKWCGKTSVFLLRETGMSGHFVGRIKGAKYRFDLQYLTWDFS